MVKFRVRKFGRRNVWLDIYEGKAIVSVRMSKEKVRKLIEDLEKVVGSDEDGV